MQAKTNSGNEIELNSSRQCLSHSVSISGVADFDQEAQNNEIRKPSGVSNLNVQTPITTSNDGESSSSSKSFPYTALTNVASSQHGARILFATDEWFAAADNLINDAPPVFDPDDYCEQGKVMDGWESRRRREAGHDWCILNLTGRSVLRSLEIDTAHFTGNHAPAISLEVADLSNHEASALASQFPGILDRLMYGCIRGTSMNPNDVRQAEQACQSVSWTTLLPPTPLNPGVSATRMHYFDLVTDGSFNKGTHIRINYFPDGGVARLRLWGHVMAPLPRPLPGLFFSSQATGSICTVVSHSSGDVLPSQQSVAFPQLSLANYGATEVVCSNRHYGRPMNLLQEELGRDMGDGWETARHPSRPKIIVSDPVTNLVDSPLSDWCVLQLGRSQQLGQQYSSSGRNGIARIIIDTKHFRGNYPESVQVQGCYLPGKGNGEDEENKLIVNGLNSDSLPVLLRLVDNDDDDGSPWFPLIARCRMSPDSEHLFDAVNGQILNPSRAVSHIKVSIFPDGGLSRIRVYGNPNENCCC